MIKRLTSFLKAAVYPNRCLACGRLIDSGGICRGCEAVFNRVPADACPMCGEAANMCECWRFKIKTNGFAAPFFNVGRVQKAFYNFKFAEKKSGAEYFGLAMANAFKSRFGNIEADVICFVPNTHDSRRHYPPRLLAEVLSRELKLPLVPDMLCKVKGNLPQHTLDFKSRVDNVKGIYAANGSLEGKIIVLVDDIRTTGATMNECAKVLKKAGAREVYGVSALKSRNLK